MNGNRIVWFLIGSAIGAGMALLYAPKSGRETRKLIGRKAEKSKLYIVDTSRDILDKGREIYDKGRTIVDEASEFIEKGRKLVNA